MEIQKEHRLRILMFPWLAHGHISPFLELAKRLAERRNLYVYLCSTPINLSSIKRQLAEKSFPCIELVEFHLPSSPDLPPHYHTTKSLPPHLMPALRKAFDMSKPVLSDLLSLHKPDLLIYDLMQTWAHSVASSLSIPAVSFITSSATSVSYFMHMVINPGVEFPFPPIYLHQNELFKIIQSIGTEDREVGAIDPSLRIILVKSFREIEAKYIDHLSELLGREVLPVGPLVQEPTASAGGDDKETNFIIEWLNNKDASSVVFISFGSEFFLSKEELEEMAYGLELSKVNFIWVIRFPDDEGVKTRVDEVLPQGFLTRVGERGMVVEGWAPQGEILRHSSVGGFVSHCGWNSVMEAMKYGVPIIAMPMHIDQPLNARLVVEVGVGKEVKREKDGEGGIVRGEVAKVINEVVIEKEGEEMRKKAKELSETIRDKGEEEIDVVVEKLLKFSGKVY